MIRAGLLLLFSVVGACADPGDSPTEIPVGQEVGLRAPALDGITSDGSTYTLADSRGLTTVLVFYRSAQCGLCRVQLEQIQQHLPAYRQLGSTIVAVTLDPEESNRRLVESLELGFALVSTEAETFQRWGLLPEGGGPPLPATVIVDERGVIRFRHVGRNAADRISDVGVITELERLKRS